jgi:NRAMP (natural resistance-associated macrophage protein)-like metal ion transporter
MNITTIIRAKAKKVVRILGPGLITGASDDDPSGIITYSQAGASFGFATLWTVIITFPLMAAVQEMCARIGIVTQEGLTAAVKKNYPKGILYIIALFSFPAITLNIGADIQCMGSVSHMLVPAIPALAYSVFFTVLLLFFIIKFKYEKFALVLKWLCISLLLYIIVPFLVKINWHEVLISTLVPTIHLDKDFINILVAILGTTISPYLFFWQATMEAEDVSKKQNIIIIRKKVIRDMQKDIDFGMLFSNLVMFFIILTTAAVLFKADVRHIDTIEQAAKALEPLTGKLTYLLFSLGVFGTGFLAIPVLAGSLSYIMAETFDWAGGLDKKFHQAKGFYITIIVSLLIGLSLDIFNVSPVQALIYTAILYGITAPVLIFIIMHICNNKKVMGEHINKKWSNILGTLTLLLMTIASLVLMYFQFK